MKTFNQFIIERLKLSSIDERLRLNKDSKIFHNYHPKDFDELRSLLEQLLEERGPDADLNDIDVSQVTSFGEKIKSGKNKDRYGLFYGLDPHNIDISKWDVRNVENMSNMFFDCPNFNSNLSKWDVSNVNNMRWLFYHCKKFNSDISSWNVSNVNDMRLMFYHCLEFDQDLSNWNVSKGIKMLDMFDGCTSLKNRPSWYDIKNKI